jgi:hypothetical protein
MTSIKKVRAMKIEESDLRTFLKKIMERATNGVKDRDELIRLAIEEHKAIFS